MRFAPRGLPLEVSDSRYSTEKGECEVEENGTRESTGFEYGGRVVSRGGRLWRKWLGRQWR